MLGLQVTTPDFPGIGNNASVGIFFLIHILIAEFSLGAITLAVAAEWHHVRTGDERTARYARSLANAYYLIFSLGATFAVFAVVLITGLWANEFGQLVNKFIWLVAAAFGLFFVLTPLLVWYRNSFKSMDPRRHATLGTAVFALQTLFMVLIVGIDAYLINPVNAGLTEPVFNPVYWPLLIHRLIGNVSWTALFCAAYATVKLRGGRGDAPERAFQSWAARVNLRIGLLTGLLMPVVGFLLVEVIKQSEPGYFDNLLSGGTAAFMVAQECLVGAMFIGGNIALASEDGWSARVVDAEPRGDRPLRGRDDPRRSSQRRPREQPQRAALLGARRRHRCHRGAHAHQARGSPRSPGRLAAGHRVGLADRTQRCAHSRHGRGGHLAADGLHQGARAWRLRGVRGAAPGGRSPAVPTDPEPLPMIHAMIARAAQFQAAWYFSLLLSAILLLIVLGIAYSLVGVRRLWRSGEHGPAAVLAGAITVAFLAFVGMYAVMIGGLLAAQGTGS